jgi:alanine racemase
LTNVRPAIRPTVAEVDLSLLTENYRLLRRTLGTRVGIIAVIKADAYGHGAVVVARLLEGLGVRGFGVATVEEGVQLRRAGVRAMILIMGAAYGGEHETVIAHQLTPMLGDPGDVDRFAEAAARLDHLRFGIHVKIDTGMTRLGVTEALFADFVRRCARSPFIRVDGLATHFYGAEEAAEGPTLEQLSRFERCLLAAREMGADPQVIHAANTAAALRFPQARFDLVRCGIGLYGAMPSSHVPDPGVRPVVSWSTRINAMREVPAGTHVSYGGTFTTKRVSRIATLPVGYADGYARANSGRAQVSLHGSRAPVVGRVCMDLCMIDVTDIPSAAVGDRVYLLGGAGESAITPSDLARWGGSIPYEVLCRISERVPRIYPGVSPAEVELAGVH